MRGYPTLLLAALWQKCHRTAPLHPSPKTPISITLWLVPSAPLPKWSMLSTPLFICGVHCLSRVSRATQKLTHSRRCRQLRLGPFALVHHIEVYLKKASTLRCARPPRRTAPRELNPPIRRRQITDDSDIGNFIELGPSVPPS